MFSNKQKVYTTNSRPISTAEDIGVQGKRYPVSALGRTLSRHPCWMLLTIVPPLVFFIIGCILIQVDLSYSLDDFRLRPSVEARKSADIYSSTLDDWTGVISGRHDILDNIDRSHTRSTPKDNIEMRHFVNPMRLRNYLKSANLDFPTFAPQFSNLLTTFNVRHITRLERLISKLPSFTALCFTNDMEGGSISFSFPACVPAASVSQYIYPSFNASSNVWHMDGFGDYMQEDYLPRVFVNPNYAWFFDNKFSPSNRLASQLRAEFTLASSPSEKPEVYWEKLKTFVEDSLVVMDLNAVHPYISSYLGGTVVENVKIERQARKEGYKIGVAFVICFALSFWHCSTFLMGLYTAAQVIFTYLAACGLYALIYRSLPLLVYSAVMWVMTFGMHGTLSFYDMFVVSGVMATKGRQNNLSLPQRLSFTLRRTVTGVWLANVLAIVIFAINTTSVFSSVRQFSIFMMIAFLWNMYFIVLPTPAFIVMHHLYFSNKRRNLQKQTDVLNAAALECCRTPGMLRVLQGVQNNAARGERVYSFDEDVIRARIGANRGINKRRYKGVGGFFREQVQQGIDKLRSARRDVYGAVHKATKTKRAYIDRVDPNAPQELPAFCVEDFMEVGDANPLGMINEDGSKGPAGQRMRPRYQNRRLVPAGAVVHVNPSLTQRSEACWSAMCAALAQSVEGSGVAAPEVPPLAQTSTAAAEVDKLAERWMSIGKNLGITNSQTARDTTNGDTMAEASPLMVRAVVRAQDPNYRLGGRPAASTAAGVGDGAVPLSEVNAASHAATATTDTEDPEQTAGTHLEGQLGVPTRGQARTGAAIVDPGVSGLGLKKLRYRWNHRRDQRRDGFCGLFGHLEETPEMRMQRLMRRKVKREGYTLFERFIISAYVPAVYTVRYALLALFVILFILVCVFGARIKPAGLPATLIVGDREISAAFESLDNTYGQRGTCTFCGPYYSPVDVYRVASSMEVQECTKQGYPNQMNLHLDRCGTCNGNDACVDCAGKPGGNSVRTSCGGCESPDANSCTCATTRDCPYCEWAELIADHGGPNCETPCNSTTCGPHGTCNQYTGACDCAPGFSGAACDACTNAFVPIQRNAQCTRECDILYHSNACNCQYSNYSCMSCPSGMRGPSCEGTQLECVHGTFNADTLQCDCNADWTGTLCNVSRKCSARGPWLSAEESPFGHEGCGCIGHWRGQTCQLCDCLNGGMCDEVTGECKCPGTFVGRRCETCAASCVANGACPFSPPKSQWNVRTCIPAMCSVLDVEKEQACAACPVGSNAEGDYCSGYTDEYQCKLRSQCWWLSSSGGTPRCTSAQPNPPSEASTSCSCRNQNVWSGTQCSDCLAPSGATCLTDGTVRGCNGLIYNDASLALGTDECGVCGGDGLCRGCDGIPGSGLTYDSCGVCGGDGTCRDYTGAQPIGLNYMIDLRALKSPLNSAGWLSQVTALCYAVRSEYSRTQTRCFFEDYLESAKASTIASFADVYSYAQANGRLGEIGFAFDEDNEISGFTFMAYNIISPLNDRSDADAVYKMYSWLQRNVVELNQPDFAQYGMSILLTSPAFQPAVARTLSKQSLWFAVGIGIAVTFVFLLTCFVSLTTAVGGTLAAAIICFGTLTVCTMFSAWEVDAIVQVCISCTIPIGVEYVVHLSFAYFDYLQTTTSHLFARSVSRRAALQGALLRSLAAICTSVLCVILTAIMFDVSPLLPSRRSGQICIAMHMIVILTVFFFSGAMVASGPMTSYSHWTLSAALCLACGVITVIVVLIIYGCGGVTGPTGEVLLRNTKKKA